MKKVMLIIVLLCVASNVFLLNAKVRFRTVSPSGGFTYDGVSSVLQDKDGFVWMMMDDELLRYDGYSFKRYRSYFVDLMPQKKWTFSSMAVSDAKFIINTNNGLFEYDKKNNRFLKIYDEKIEMLCFDNKNNLWIKINSDWGIFDFETKNFHNPMYDGKSLKIISNFYARHKDDFFLFSNYGKIFRYNYQKMEFSLFMELPNLKRIVGVSAQNGLLWIMVDDAHIYKINLATFQIEEQIDLWEGGARKIVRSFYIDKNDFIWVGTNAGLYVYNTHTKMLAHYTHSETDAFSLANNSIWTISEDRERNLWIGTFSGAVSYVNIDEKAGFSSFFPNQNKLNHSPVSAFSESENDLWIGTEGGGLNKLNKATGKYSYFNVENNVLKSNNIKSILHDKFGDLWVGTFRAGISCITNNQKNVRHFTLESKHLLSNNIRKLVSQPDSGYWVIYQKQAIIFSFYSYATSEFVHYDFSNDNENEYIFDAVKGSGNTLWLLTRENIYYFDIHTKRLNKIDLDVDRFLNFTCLVVDDAGNLWVGTTGNGLMKYNVLNAKTEFFNDILKFNVSSIFSIAFDNSAVIWMGTDNGLLNFDINKRIFASYSKQDGTQGGVYNPLAVMNARDGQIYIGGTNGYTVLKPSEISRNLHMPKAIISEFYIDNEPKNFILKGPQNEEFLELSYKQNNFGFKFSSENFLIPQKNRFKYRLNGYDNRWIEVDANNRTAMYSKVKAGTYFFELMAANNDGVWGSEVAILKIVVMPPWWLSWAAYLLYLTVIVLITFFILKHYKDKKALELSLFRESLEKQKKEELHQSQLRFFTNVSHDLKTPISLIVTTLESLRKEGLKEYYYSIINNNANRLLNLVNELLDFRTIENNKMKLSLTYDDFVAFVSKLAMDFQDFASKKQIEFIVTSEEGLQTEFYFDKNIVEKIVMNLLNNAMKYSAAGAKVVLHIHNKNFVSQYEHSFCVNSHIHAKKGIYITISDTGVGISKDSIASVFDRFYKVSTVNLDSHLGTGIGLALVKSLVLLHKGNICIYSERDKGTDMNVFIPTDESLFSSECFAQNEAGKNQVLNEVKPVLPASDSSISEIASRKTNYKVLLVEDNDELRTLLSEYLSDDFRVVEASNGLDALKIVAKTKIDLIISDIMMPLMDGISMCKKLKTDAQTSYIPIMLLTAKSGLESHIEGADSGADYYFEKPVTPLLLRKTIYNVFASQQNTKEYFAKNYFAEDAERNSNERDVEFIRSFLSIVDKNLSHSNMDVNEIAAQLSMSRSKLYRKVKTLTGMSIVEFILSYKMKKAAKLLLEQQKSIREIMDEIGIESQAYFSNSFKKEYGLTPTAFVAQQLKQNDSN